MEPKQPNNSEGNQQNQNQQPQPPVVQDVVAPAAPQPQPDETIAPTVAPAPEQNDDVVSQNESPASSQSSEASASESPFNEATSDEGNNEAKAKNKTPKKPLAQPKVRSQKPLGFITLAIVVSVSLMALVVMSFMNQSSDDQENQTTEQSTENEDGVLPTNNDVLNDTRPADEGFEPGEVVPQPTFDDPITEEDESLNGSGADPVPGTNNNEQ